MRIGNIGSRNAYTIFYLTKKHGVIVLCGCFLNSIEIFEDRVKKTHNDNQYLNEYLMTIEYVKKMYEYYKSISEVSK